MKCIFCNDNLQYISEGQDIFNVYACRDCQKPNHKTIYRQLYNSPNYKSFNDYKGLLSDSMRVDEYYVVRYYVPGSRGDRFNYTIIFKEALGFLESSPEMEPISLNKPVCEIDHVIELPWHDIVLVKKKLDIWTTFS